MPQDGRDGLSLNQPKEIDMNKNHRYARASIPAVFALAAALMVPAAVQAQPAKAASGMAQGNMASTKPMSGEGMDMKAMMKDMNEKMASMPMTGKPDIDFAMMMRIHHEGAIQMAEAQLRDGKEPQMRKMAKDIVSAQKKEIAQLDKFLATHGHAAAMKK